MIAIYETTTGLVRRTVQCPDEEIAHNVKEDESYVYVDAHLKEPHMVVGDTLVTVLRPARRTRNSVRRLIPTLGNN